MTDAVAPDALPWPPAGLEPLRGKLDRAARHLAWSATLTALSIVTAISRGSAATQLLGTDAVLVVVGTVFVGMLWLMWATDLTRGVCLQLWRGRRAGFAWRTLLEVGSDRTGDGGDLVSGRGRAAALSPDARRQLRVARLLATAAPIATGLLTLLVLMFFVRATNSDAAETGTLVLLVCLGLGGFVLRAVMQRFERRHLPPAAAARRLAPLPDLRRQAEAWAAASSAAAEGASLGRSGSSAAAVAHVAHLVVLLLGWATFVVAMVVILASILGPMFLRMTAPQFANMERRIDTALGLKRLAVVADSSITPLDAGIAFATMDFRRDVRDDGFPRRDRAPMLTPPWHDSAPPGLTIRGVAAVPASAAWIDSVRRRLTPAELAWMRNVAAYPGWQQMATVAHAPAVDFAGGRFELPFGDRGTAFELPIATFSVYREYAQANAHRVRFFLETNRPDSAVQAATELMSFGLRLAEDSRWMVEALLGTILATAGRDQLERTYAVLKDPRRDTLLRVSRDAATRAVERRRNVRDVDLGSDPERIIRQWRQVAGDPDHVRALRWEAATLLGLAVCTDARGLLRGPSPDLRESFDRFLRIEARWASDSALIAVMRAGPLRQPVYAPDSDPRIMYRVVNGVGALLGTPYPGACLRLLDGFAY